MTDKIIKGSGGAPPSPPTPYRAPDTLNKQCNSGHFGLLCPLP